jgi:hypothetical protein
MMRGLFATAALAPLFVAQIGWFSKPDEFEPRNRLSGIGVDRGQLTDAVLERRTQLMIETQTFGILRDPRALAGAERVTSPKLKRIFEAASRRSGLPASFIAAVAYLESWGEAHAVSPAGPKGIMQFAQGTARIAGLKMVYAKRYRTVTVRRQVGKRKGKPVYRTTRRRVPYTVLVRDERLIPEKAVPAAANYLASLESKFGGRDWALFAYHCGEGCVSNVRSIVQRSNGLGDEPVSVARAFFSASPAHNRDLYEALMYHMERDFSPTYWFRIMRAEQLLRMYESQPAKFKQLYSQYRNHVKPNERAPHRLSVWLTPDDLAFRTCDDLKRESAGRLVRAFDDEKFFGFRLRRSGAGAIGEFDPPNQQYYLQASPSVMGTIAYVAFETRRMHKAMGRRGERYVPLEITALVQPLDYEERAPRRHGSGKEELPAHCTGLVFDLNYGNLPPGQRQALEFVLADLGWDGYVGFVQDSASSDTFHVGAAPTARDFFTRVYEEAVAHARESD